MMHIILGRWVAGFLFLVFAINTGWFIRWIIPTEPQDLDAERLSIALNMATVQLEPYALVFGSYNTSPPKGSPAKGRISSVYGMRVHPIHGRPRMHHGVDIAVPVGTSVQVTADGWIHRVKHDPEGYGLFVDVIHPGLGYMTRYAHLSKVFTKSGIPVTRGTVIATSGNSGRSTGPHLHYEVLRDEEYP